MSSQYANKTLIGIAPDNKDFFSPKNKPERESWVIEMWCHNYSINLTKIVVGDDPPDFLVDGQAVEVVEAIPNGYRRGDENRKQMELAKAGKSELQMPHSEIHFLSIQTVKSKCHDWVIQQIDKKNLKYGNRSDRWILLFYYSGGWGESIQWQKIHYHLSTNLIHFQFVDVMYSGDNSMMVKRFPVLARNTI
jgi:hypothetical protein